MGQESKQNMKNEVFIGARSLENQVNLILPTYDLLLEQIKQIRQVKEVKEDKVISKRENNNTIGIFGARGTGKTSVLYTIMEQLKKGGSSNIILPIIEPDNFGENTKIIGSIVGLLSAAIDEELEYIKNEVNNDDKKNYNEFFNDCIYKEKNPLNLKRRELIEYYAYTESEYRNLLANNYNDISTHIEKTSYLLIPDIEFKRKLSDLIDALIEIRQKHDKDLMPMIFIFIDDIDLKTTKCRELIDSILQYSNHPNVITFLSGDYDILKEAVTLSLISDENLAHSNLRIDHKINPYESIWDRKLYLSNEYLKKIIPPARRHNLVNWNIDSIPKFAFGETNLSYQLNSFMGDKNLFAYSFQGGDDEDKLIPIKSTYSIFDKTPRGLINVYYHIHQINVYKDKHNEKKYFKDIKALIDTIIVSSGELVDEQKKFFEKCLLWGDTAESTFIDYDEILKYNEEDSGTYKIHESFFNIFLICEILKELVKGINYEEDDYNKTKNMVLNTLYLDPENKLKNGEITLHKTIYKKDETSGLRVTYLHQIALAVAENIDFKTALILLQELISSNLKDDYSYSFKGYSYNYYNESEYDKNKNTFMSIYNLTAKIDSNKDLLKRLYLKSYHDKYDDPLTKTFSFLNNMCATTSEYDINEKTFKILLEDIFKKGEIKANESESEDCYRDNKIKRMLLINTFIKIQEISAEDIEKISEKLDKSSKDYKELNFIRMLNSNINNMGSESNDSIQRNIKRIIGGLGKHIQKDILTVDKDDELKLMVNDDGALKKGTEEFIGSSYRNPCGTRYADAKEVINEIIKNNIIKETNADDKHIDVINIKYYKIMIEKIRMLSINNRVWYGRVEAIRFLTVLNQQFHLDLDIFKEKIPLIRELAKYLKQSDRIIKEYNEFEKIKIDMRERLKEAAQNAKIDIESELEDLGDNLGEEEKRRINGDD